MFINSEIYEDAFCKNYERICAKVHGDNFLFTVSNNVVNTIKCVDVRYSDTRSLFSQSILMFTFNEPFHYMLSKNDIIKFSQGRETFTQVNLIVAQVDNKLNFTDKFMHIAQSSITPSGDLDIDNPEKNSG